MAKAGFEVEVIKERDLISVKKRLGVPLEIQACHTATVAGYFVEGHVPVASVKRLIESKDQHIAGLVVPACPRVRLAWATIRRRPTTCSRWTGRAKPRSISR
jgi:hypothetical protein